ncbi:MAG TPA: hypothetical protein VI566_03315, partial [Xanthomonadales bacterium]|nr:hypothetical protein [Xanthomonadales bacterium]
MDRPETHRLGFRGRVRKAPVATWRFAKGQVQEVVLNVLSLGFCCQIARHFPFRLEPLLTPCKYVFESLKIKQKQPFSA